VDDVTAAWRVRATQWLDFARTPGHDVFFDQLNLPWFAELLPAAGRRTLDVGCGEGRLEGGSWYRTDMRSAGSTARRCWSTLLATPADMTS
jgi:hypothetical protein